MRLFGLAVLFFSMVSMGVAQENRIDIVRPDAPELAGFGEYDIGVQTLEFVDPNRIDILNTKRGGDSAIYDRSLTVEVWYPRTACCESISRRRVSGHNSQSRYHCDAAWSRGT